MVRAPKKPGCALVNSRTVRQQKRLRADIQAATTALNDLGWRDADARLYQDQRDYLSKHNGIRGLDLVASTEIERARDLFYRDGFVVVVDALTSQQLERLRAACDRAIHNIMALDKQRIGNRGSHRYSFGAASKTGHMMHDPAWAMLLDLPTVTPIDCDLRFCELHRTRRRW